MKNSFLAVFLLLGQAMPAQPVVKVYAYSQVITPGIVRQRDIPVENGSAPASKASAATHYYIYAVVSPAVSLQPRQVWIQGQWYTIGGSTIEKTPVQIEVPAPRVLVPATRQKVIQVEPGDSLPVIKKPSSALVKMMKQSELIFSYQWKGKLYYTPVTKITVLEKVHAQ